VEAVPGASGSADIVDIAAVVVSGMVMEKSVFQTYVNPGRPVFKEGCSEALRTLGASSEDLGRAPGPKEAADSFREFMGRHPGLAVHVFNLERARKLLGAPPWNLDLRWGSDIRKLVVQVMEDEAGPSQSEIDPKSVKLYDAARFLNLPVPLTRYALSDARMAKEIFGKLAGMKDTMSALDRDFLSEAAYLMEDGL
jgi:DNA polymerase III epsilon subunit-like protein